MIKIHRDGLYFFFGGEFFELYSLASEVREES
jgi:hypothetical protein